MRFKKGSKVEVMNKEMPATWHVAEIISGNVNAYNGYQGMEKVSRRFIRPYAPAISSQSWVTGDIVEVFDENSWKIATVLKVLKGGRFLVRPHGFTHEIRAHKTNIRARLSWCDGYWSPVGKILESNGIEPNFQEEDDCLPVYNDARLHELKRASPFCSYIPVSKKVRPSKKNGSQSQRHFSGYSFEKILFLVMGNLLILHGMKIKLQDTIGGIDLLLPKGQNKILVLLPFYWKKQWDMSAYAFAYR